MNFHCGSDAYGGGGGDHMSCYGRGNAIVYGGYGEDHIVTLDGNDIINAGPGMDDVNAGGGNDEVYIYNECELEPGEQMAGGAGYDVLFVPFGMTVNDLDVMGIVYTGFEEIIALEDDERGYSECLWQL